MTVRLTRSAFALCLVSCIAGNLWAAASLHGGQEAQASTVVSQPQPDGATGNSAARKVYVIGDADVLEVNVWNEPDLKQSLPVRSDGKITLPLIGSVQAAGKTTSELQDAIASKLKTYIHNPTVTVMVLQMNSRKFNILGRVAKPGSYPLSATTTVLDAIAEAGGFQEFAKQKDIYILRQKTGGGEARIRFNYKSVISGKHPEENITLEPHDTVIVP